MTLEQPQRVLLPTPGGAKGSCSSKMFWVVAPREVIGKPVNTQCPKIKECVENKKVQDGKGIKDALDPISTQSKSDAIEN